MRPLASPTIHPSRVELPVLLSIPHSGRDYPDWLIGLASGGRAALETLEDPLVDRLAWRAIASGIGAVVANAPRAAVDCNRAEDEIDPSVIDGGRPRRQTPRSRGGLGIVPGRTPYHGYLWRRPICDRQLEDRLDQAHRPYHDLIARQLGEIRRDFGEALLLDCHSMPPPGRGVPPVVLGDCHGRSAARWVALEAMRIARDCGFEAGLNDPFAGGHVVERHGRPEEGCHALQIEIDRRCYLTDGGAPGPGFDRVAMLFERLALGLGQALLDRQAPIAAE